MKCPSCGVENKAQARFCYLCGTAFGSVAPEPVPQPEPAVQPNPVVEQPMPVQPVFEQPAYAPYPQPTYAYPQPTAPVSPLTQALGKSCRSPLFLIAAICMTLAELGSILTALQTDSGQSYTFRLLALILASSEGVGMTVDITRVGFFFDLLMTIPGMLTIIGMWVVYGSGFAKDRPMSTGGFSCLKAGVVVNIVFTALLGAFLILFVLVSGFSHVSVVDLSLAVVGISLLLALLFVFYGFCSNALSKAQRIARGQQVSGLPMFVSIGCFAYVVLVLAGYVLGMTVISEPGTPYFWMQIFFSIRIGNGMSLMFAAVRTLYAISFLLLGIGLIRCRSRLKQC